MVTVSGFDNVVTVEFAQSITASGFDAVGDGLRFEADAQVSDANVIGAELARESHVDADLVVPVPDSGVPAAIASSTSTTRA